MNNADHLLNIAQAGVELTTDEDAFLQMNLLVVLMDIEDSLDKGRNLLGGLPEKVSEINKKLEVLRSRIRSTLDAMGPEKAREFLDGRGEQMKRRFEIR